MPPAVDFLGQMLGAAFVLLIGLYGAVFDPLSSGYRRPAAVVAVLAGAWLIMLMIVAGSARA